MTASTVEHLEALLLSLRDQVDAQTDRLEAELRALRSELAATHVDLHRLRAEMHELYADAHPLDDGPLLAAAVRVEADRRDLPRSR